MYFYFSNTMFLKIMLSIAVFMSSFMYDCTLLVSLLVAMFECMILLCYKASVVVTSLS